MVADGGSVIDAAHFTPCPLGSMEVYLPASTDLYKPGLPPIDDIDFIEDILVPKPTQTEVDAAFANATPDEPVAVVTLGGPEMATDGQFVQNRSGSGVLTVPEGWEIASQETFDGTTDLTVSTYEKEGRR